MKKLSTQDDLAGKTIRSCLSDKDGRGLVLVFDDNDWCAFEVENGGSEDAGVTLGSCLSGRQVDIKHYLVPSDLLAADLLSRPQYELLLAENKTREAAMKRNYAQRLLAEAAALDQEESP